MNAVSIFWSSLISTYQSVLVTYTFDPPKMAYCFCRLLRESLKDMSTRKKNSKEMRTQRDSTEI